MIRENAGAWNWNASSKEISPCMIKKLDITFRHIFSTKLHNYCTYVIKKTCSTESLFENGWVKTEQQPKVGGARVIFHFQ